MTNSHRLSTPLYGHCSVLNYQEEDDSDDDIVKITAQPKEVKIKSMKEAMSMLEDVTEYLTDENLTDMANNLSRVLSKVQSTWLAQRLNAATQTKVTDFFK